MVDLPFRSLDQALAWLDDHIDYESNMPTRRTLPSLDRMRELMALLGDPQRDFTSVHITGTNGKGSTSALVTNLLRAVGLSVGTYTSPNLARVNERLARHGQPIDDESFAAVLSTVALAEQHLSEPATRFELLTAAAFEWFADEALEVAVVEVGLGGSWDCTNVIDALVAVVTNISFDHMEVLGPTLEGIASDKAGIVKAGSRVIVGEPDPDLSSVIVSAAEAAGAERIWLRESDFGCTSNDVAVGGRLLDLRTPGAAYTDLFLPLHGAHQGDNAACAVAAAEALLGSTLDPDVVEEAFAATSVPGRLEVVGHDPFFLVDGAHNVAGMEALARSLAGEFATEGGGTAVVGFLDGRDPLAMLGALAPTRIETIVACEPRSPRAMPTGVVAEAARAVGFAVHEVPSIPEAVDLALALAGGQGWCVAAGSLYVVTDVRQLLLGRVAGV